MILFEDSCRTANIEIPKYYVNDKTFELFYDKHKQSFTISFNPRSIFEGDIFSIDLKLDNEFENYLKIFTVKYLFD